METGVSFIFVTFCQVVRLHIYTDTTIFMNEQKPTISRDASFVFLVIAGVSLYLMLFLLWQFSPDRRVISEAEEASLHLSASETP